MTKTICILAYEGIALLDLSGPQSAFYEANQAQPGSYDLKVGGALRGQASSGIYEALRQPEAVL